MTGSRLLTCHSGGVAASGRTSGSGALRAVLLAFFVLVVIVGVVTMHSLGVGHQPSGMAQPDHSMAAGVGSSAGHSDGLPSSSQRMPVLVTLPSVAGCRACPQEAVAALGAAVSLGAAASGGMPGMCLAVLPLLLLLLGRLTTGRARSAIDQRLRGVRRALSPISPRPPHHLCPSLSSLCILRT